LTLNLAVPDGQKILASLIAKGDVLIDNFKLGTLDKWGFSDAWFEANAPRLVRCSITGYGSSGPKAALPGYDFVLQAESGLMSICGEPDGMPMKYGVAIVDVCTGMLAANAVLHAVNARQRTGRVQKVELSLYETSLAMLVRVGVSYLNTGSGDGRIGNGHGSLVPYATYRAADGMLVIAVGNDMQFARCAAVLGHPEWSEDERFRTNRARVERRALVDGLINEWRARDGADAWIEKLKGAGVPCGRINSVAQALNHPHTAARSMVETAEHPLVGQLKMLGIPFKFSGTPASVRRPPPTLGQHTEELLTQELGLDAKT